MWLVVVLAFILHAKEMIRRHFYRNQFLRALAGKKKKLSFYQKSSYIFHFALEMETNSTPVIITPFFKIYVWPLSLFPDRLFQNLITSEKNVWRANEAKL
jgi:hypothetical protein